MALVLADRVKETTTSTGTTAITLAGATTGYQTFSSAVGNANTTYYTIADQTGANWEVGIGTYTTSGNTLSRDTVLASSNAGSLVTFTAGTKDVFVTYPAERALYSGGALGTPASGTLTNCTFPTLNQNTTGYAGALKSATTIVSVSGATAPSSGQVLMATGSTSATWQTPAGSSPDGAFRSVVVFTASGTYTPTAGMVRVKVSLVGGGGGGGASYSSSGNNYGSSGGGGGGSIGVFSAATVGASQIITIGAGGTGGATDGANGTAGGTTSFGALMSATGGRAGSNPNNGGGSGGLGSSGSLNVVGGGGGGGGFYGPGSQASGSTGGSSLFGGGSIGASLGSSAGGAYGGGGAGGATYSIYFYAGGAGASGVVFIEEFF